jgi:hypothetical protein
MKRKDWNLLIGLVSATCLALVWGVRDGVITMEQASATMRTIVMLGLTWLFLESIS